MSIVTSKFVNGFAFKTVIFIILVLVWLVGHILVLIKLIMSAQWYPLSIVGGFFLLFFYFFFRLLTYALVKITIAPEGIFWKNLIKNKTTVITYEEIEHVANFRTTTNTRSVSNYRTLQIDLFANKQFSFTSLQFENYNELRDAIWENRHRPVDDAAANS